MVWLGSLGPMQFYAPGPASMSIARSEDAGALCQKVTLELTAHWACPRTRGQTARACFPRADPSGRNAARSQGTHLRG